MAALASAAVIGAGIGVALLAVAGSGPSPRRGGTARLEQTIVDRSAALTVALAFSPNGMLLAVTDMAPTGSESAMGSTSVYNLATGQQRLFLQRANGGGVNDVAFSPDGRTLVVTADSNTRTEIRMWDLRTGKPERPLPAGFSSVAYSPDPKPGPRSRTPCPAASRCRATAFSSSSSASSCADPMCSICRDPR